MPRTFTVRPHAKINLTLRVGAIRADGFHDVRTLMQAVDLSDTLTVTSRPGPFAIAARAPAVPTDKTNLVWRAADLLWRALGRAGDPRDAHVKISKKIPAAAGLGGGSADAAAALLALNRIWNAKRSTRQLRDLSAALGADVPYFFAGGTALGTGRGDELYPVDDVARLGVVIIKPSFGVPTADAYRWLDDDRAREVAISETALPSLDVGWPTGPIALANDLQAPVARRHPKILEMIDACMREGAVAAAMTGSGSAVFGLFLMAIAPKAARKIRRPGWLVIATRTLSRRESNRRIGL
jgi:4-diphosphocytidyl-2-C-methyl-D-erythritol kinase